MTDKAKIALIKEALKNNARHLSAVALGENHVGVISNLDNDEIYGLAIDILKKFKHNQGQAIISKDDLFLGDGVYGRISGDCIILKQDRLVNGDLVVQQVFLNAHIISNFADLVVEFTKRNR